MALVKHGLNVKMNVRLTMKTQVRGFQLCVLDLAVYNPQGNMMAIFYVGPDKERKLLKYKATRIQMFKVVSEADVNKTIGDFLVHYANTVY